MVVEVEIERLVELPLEVSIRVVDRVEVGCLVERVDQIELVREVLVADVVVADGRLEVGEYPALAARLVRRKLVRPQVLVVLEEVPAVYERHVALVELGRVVGDLTVGHRTVELLEGLAHAVAELPRVRVPEAIPVVDALERTAIEALEVERRVEVQRHHLRIAHAVQLDAVRRLGELVERRAPVHAHVVLRHTIAQTRRAGREVYELVTRQVAPDEHGQEDVEHYGEHDEHGELSD